MGFLVWAILTAAALFAGLALALRPGKHLGVGEQLAAAGTTAVALVLFCVQLLGYLSVLYAWSLALLVATLSLVIVFVCRDARFAWPDFRGRFVSAVRASLLTPASALISAAALLLGLYLAACIWLLPSWGWDAMWYHNAISALAAQEHSLGWVDSHIPFVNSYPKNIELLAMWNVIFAPDDRLVDGAQWPLVWLGVLSLACICRRAGATPPLAWGLALLWLLMPAVLLNIPSGYVDVGAASLWLVAVLFLARLDATWVHRLFGTLALGCYLGAKVSGLLHAVMIAPLVAVAVVLEARREKRRWFVATAEIVAMIGGLLLLGGATYLRDLARFGNPFWPAQVPVPLLGIKLNGYWRMTDLNTPPFGGPDDLAALFRSFAEMKPFWFVDVRLGGFGPLWLGVLLPLSAVALVWGAARMWKRQASPGLLAALWLLITAVATPARWWPRYTLGFPAGGLVAAAFVLSRISNRYVQQGLLASLGIFAVVQAWPARSGWRAPPELLARAWSLTPEERSHLRFDVWQQEQIAMRDKMVQPGESSIYDDSVSFIYQLWRYDWRNRVLYLPLKGDPNEWLSRLDQEHVRWAAIKRSSLAERTLSGAGWHFLYPCIDEDCHVWARP
jgi:hypothetical protein